MKKILFIASALAGLFFAASCQQELDQPETAGKTVTFTVEAPAAIQTKAIADGLNVNQLIYEVWITGDKVNPLATPVKLYQGKTDMKQDGNRMKADVTLDLINDQAFEVLFWAQKKDLGVYNTTELKAVTYLPNTPEGGYAYAANDNRLDAFYGKAYVVDGFTETPTVTLRRPFAQVNLCTLNNKSAAQADGNYNVALVSSKMRLDAVPTKFNVSTSVATEYKAMDFIANAVPSDPSKITVNGKEYWYAGMNYVFAGANIVLTYDINTKLNSAVDATVNNTVYDVPLRENHRTNIVGNLLTSKTDFEIFVDANFATPDFVEEVWNGSEISEPAYDELTETYSVEMASELAWIAAAVNGTLETRAAVPADSFQGKTVKLTKDINLNGKEWTPIGNSTNIFKGTFDGQNHVVSNLVITGNNSNVGLFGVTHEGEIKNLVVENAKVSGRLNVGVVAGTPYTSKYTNITVKGHVEVNGMAYVGGVGGKNAYADWTNVKVEADETSYVNANSVENGTAYRTYVGGVVGFNGEGSHKFTNISSNINVTGSTCDVGGLFGIAHYGNQFENCSCSGDVKITAAEEAEEAEEIGGIAGVWMDSDEGAVTFSNVSFTGEVTTNVERETVWYDNLFGKPYNNNGKGKLIVDGIEMLANGVGLKDGEYYVTSAQGLVWVEAQDDNFFAGKTIKLAKNIDMTGVSIEKPIHFWSGRTTFDGQNYTISNLSMSTDSTEKKPFSLFTGTADIKNVKFDKANISGYSYVAVVAGNLYGNIENCHVSNSNITCTYWMAGALSGQYNAGNVTGCSVTNTIVTGPAAVGALLGVINEAKGERKVENCTVSGCTIAQKGSFGGDYDEMFASVVGLINIDNSNVHFNNCNVEKTTIKGAESSDLFGRNGGAETVVYINGNEFVTDGVTKNSEGNYLISSAAGLRWVADEVNVNKNNFAGKTVKLEADVDLENAPWTPVGQTGATTFNGVFDGQNHIISNLTVDSDAQTGANYSSGLFGWVESHSQGHGHIKNVKISGATITGHHNCGALVGYITDGNALVENCHVTGATISCTKANADADGDKAGALIGNATVATPVKDCTAKDSTVSGGRDSGQLIGAGKEANITGCSATNVTVSANGTGTGANVRNEVIGRLLN